MFHLLPEEQKKILEHEYRYRLLLIILSFVVGSLIVASVFLFPSYLLSRVKLADINLRNEQAKEAITVRNDPALSGFLSTLRDNLAALNPLQELPHFSPLIKKITGEKNSGVSLNEISYDREKIVLRGVADDRNSLTSFADSLRIISEFSNVDLPISDLAPSRDIDFTITITLK